MSQQGLPCVGDQLDGGNSLEAAFQGIMVKGRGQKYRLLPSHGGCPS